MNEIILKTDNELGVQTVVVGQDPLTGLDKFRRMKSFFYDVHDKQFRVTYEEWQVALDGKVYQKFYQVNTYYAVNITDVEPNELLYDAYFNLFNPIISPDVNNVIQNIDGNVVREANTNLQNALGTDIQIAKDWAEGESLQIGNIRKFEGNRYVVIQAHTTQADWTPPLVPALFLLIPENTDSGYPLWVQPTGAHDAYQIGDRVTHNEQNWESTHADNVWEPGVFGWTLLS